MRGYLMKKDDFIRIDMERLPEGCDRTNVMSVLVETADNTVSRSAEVDLNCVPYVDITIEGGTDKHIPAIKKRGFNLLPV